MSRLLNRIITKTGDDGDTSLADGSRWSKNSARVESIGCVDELNSLIGVLLAEPLNQAEKDWLNGVQNSLFIIGASLALDKTFSLNIQSITDLEKQASLMSVDLPDLIGFVLPRGIRAAALAHQIRTVCRRAERMLFALSAQDLIDKTMCTYLNRLSDCMFILACRLNHQAGVSEVIWHKN